MIVKIARCRNCNGAQHNWIFDQPTLLELRRIKKLTGLSAVTMGDAIDEGDPDAMAALLDLLHRRQNIVIPWDEIDLDFDALDMRPDAEDQEVAAQAESNPGGKHAAPPTTPSGAPTEAGSTPWSAPMPSDFGATSA
ncbi:hypothetical protein ABZ468_25955 [Streptomyces sp. NPDC005708]|uniref:hypothetical protein n=1 Tax=Streptomyces sp. NPDC005708 TaxID=3154564 RepID=UPI0033C49D51